MENLDKLFQLYESGDLLLAIQLCKANDIDKRVFIRMLFDKYLDRNADASRAQSFYYNNNINIRFYIFYYTTVDKYSFWYVLNDFYSEQRYDTLDNILDKFLEIIEDE